MCKDSNRWKDQLAKRETTRELLQNCDKTGGGPRRGLGPWVHGGPDSLNEGVRDPVHSSQIKRLRSPTHEGWCESASRLLIILVIMTI
jgi:hypothetical protein